MKLPREELLGYKEILRCFEWVSGLRINLRKNTLIGVGLEEGMLNSLATKIGCGLRNYLLLIWGH